MNNGVRIECKLVGENGNVEAKFFKDQESEPFHEQTLDPEIESSRMGCATMAAEKLGEHSNEVMRGWAEEIRKQTEPQESPRIYSRRIWQPTRRKIRNVRDGNYVDKKGEEHAVRYYVGADEIAKELRDATGNWPRQASRILFAIVENSGGPNVVWFKRTDELFAWICNTCVFQWEGGSVIHPDTKDTLTPLTKGEFLEYLRNNPILSYDAVEKLPHYPPIDDLFYLPFKLPEIPPMPTPLQTLIQRFNPDSELDRQLMTAALLTPGWGGPPGARPAFVFCSEHGRGTGKTVTAEVLADIWGGAISIGVREDWEKAKGRLLGNEAMTQRIVFIDNIKGKLHGSEIEGLITCKRIDGWKPYHGGASRPNLMTWYLTSNVPSLSQDLAERSVVIRVGPKKHFDSFVTWAGDFVKQHRDVIRAELIDILKDQAQCSIERENRDRWGAWQDAILTRWDNGNEIAAEIIARRPGVDADIDDANEIAAVVKTMVGKVGGFERAVIQISRQQLQAQLVNAGVFDKKAHPKMVTSIVKDKLGLGALKCLSFKKLADDRVWIYTGPDADPDDDPVKWEALV